MCLSKKTLILGSKRQKNTLINLSYLQFLVEKNKLGQCKWNVRCCFIKYDIFFLIIERKENNKPLPNVVINNNFATFIGSLDISYRTVFRYCIIYLYNEIIQSAILSIFIMYSIVKFRWSNGEVLVNCWVLFYKQLGII